MILLDFPGKIDMNDKTIEMIGTIYVYLLSMNDPRASSIEMLFPELFGDTFGFKKETKNER